jgi:hypothetical protein
MFNATYRKMAAAKSGEEECLWLTYPDDDLVTQHCTG